MANEIWTASLHRPPDCRKLDAKAREVLIAGLKYVERFASTQGHSTQHDELIVQLRDYKQLILDEVLSPIMEEEKP